MLKKKNGYIVILLILISVLFLISFYIQNHDVSVKNSRASSGAGCQCNDPSHCYPDGCSRDINKLFTVCGDFPNDGPAPGDSNPNLCVKPPDCCSDVVNEHNPRKCCWIERGFCRPEQCDQATNDVSGFKDNCGWYWHYHDGHTNTEEGYGCVIGSSKDNLKPIYGNAFTPPPTMPPSIPPTDIPDRNPNPVITYFQGPTIAQPTDVPNITLPPSPASYKPPFKYPPDQPTVYANSPVPSLQPATVTAQPAGKPVLKNFIRDAGNWIDQITNSLVLFFSAVLP